MPFQPAVNDLVPIDGVSYRVAEHPVAPGMPNGQEGRQATVYELVAGPARRALKVLKPRYRFPSIVTLSERLATFSDIPGLDVCRRTVLTEQRQGQLLLRFPDLTYASLMPWIEGPTWMEVLLDKRPLSQEGSRRLATALANLLATLEKRGSAHCDLSGANVLLPALRPGNGLLVRNDVALVDVEQLYAPSISRPDRVPAGSPGCGHPTATGGIWQRDADRFAGAVLIAEMAGWCDQRVRDAAWGESYFDPAEIGRDCARYRTLVAVLSGRWGREITELFEQAWGSSTLSRCATLEDWLRALSPADQPTTRAPESTAPGGAKGDSDQAAYALLAMGRSAEARGNLRGALETYRQALKVAPPSSRVVAELNEAIRVLAPTSETGTSPLGTQTGSNTFAWMSEADLKRLFRDAKAACDRGDLPRAEDLILQVVRSKPGYQLDGQTAEQLLAKIRAPLTMNHAPGRPPDGPIPRWTPSYTPASGKPRPTPPPQRGPTPQPAPNGVDHTAGVVIAALTLAIAAIIIILFIIAAILQNSKGSQGAQAPASTPASVAGQSVAPAAIPVAPNSLPISRPPPPTPRPLATPSFVVNSLDVGCHAMPSAGASIDVRLPPGTIQAMNLVEDTDGTWQHDADRLCWTRTDPGPIRQFASFPQALDYAVTIPHKPGEVILADKLSDASRGMLPNLTGTQGLRLAYADGEYVIAKTDASYRYVPSAFLPGTYGDSTLSIDARLVGQTQGRYVEIGCRQQQTDGHSAYSLAVDLYSGSFGLARWDNGRQVDLVSMRSSAAISRGNQKNRLALNCSGSAISASINGVQVAAAQDSTYKEGRSWIGASTLGDSSASTAEGRFSNLSLVKR